MAGGAVVKVKIVAYFGHVLLERYCIQKNPPAEM